MNFFKKLFGKSPKEAGVSARGMIVFHHTAEVIAAETLLKQAGMEVQVKGPPPALRTGCDMVIEFPLISELEAIRILNQAKITPIQVVTVEDPLLEPVSLFHVKDFGDYLMVRAANMKITVAKHNQEIVNISGGGCPDVPYLAEVMVGKSLLSAPEPRTMGKTLCGYALQLAYKEIIRQCHG